MDTESLAMVDEVEELEELRVDRADWHALIKLTRRLRMALDANHNAWAATATTTATTTATWPRPRPRLRLLVAQKTHSTGLSNADIMTRQDHHPAKTTENGTRALSGGMITSHRTE